MSLIKNLEIKIGEKRISIPSWELPSEGIAVLMGDSGCGKTTVLRTLCGLHPAEAPFEWIVNGVDISKLALAEKRLGVVFQGLELFPHLSARRNILFAASARKIMNADKKIDDLLSELGLESVAHRRANQLSGGERQRVALARALIGEPRYLLLDEPFSALDDSNKDQARSLLKKIITEKKVPTLLITHDQRDAIHLATTTFKLNQTISPVPGPF